MRHRPLRFMVNYSVVVLAVADVVAVAVAVAAEVVAEVAVAEVTNLP
jgi:hypothetical protein